MRTTAEREARADPTINLVGNRIALGPLRRDLIPTDRRSANDGPTGRPPGPAQPATLDQETTPCERRAKAAHAARFTIHELAARRPIGLTYLYETNPHHHGASFGILIGEAECRSKGYQSRATRLGLHDRFTILGLHNVMLTVCEFDVAGRRADERAGFQEIGRRHECSPLSGRLWDVISMECLARDFPSPRLGAIFRPEAPRRAREPRS